MVAENPNGMLNFIGRNSLPIIAVFGTTIFLVLLPQSIFYRGLVSGFAEWQYYWWGSYYPVLTIVLPILLGLLIFLLILFILFWRRKRNVRKSARDEENHDRAGQTIAASLIAMKSFFALALISAIGAIITVLLAFMLPGANGGLQKIDVGSVPYAKPREGSAQLEGVFDWQKLSNIDYRVPFAVRNMYFVPIVSKIGPHRSTRYFVQVFRDEFILPNNGAKKIVPEYQQLLYSGAVISSLKAPAGSIRGILKRDGLPDELVFLYRQAGIEVHKDPFVLYRNTNDLRWTHWVIASEFLLFAIIAVLVGLFFRHQRRWLVRIL